MSETFAELLDSNLKSIEVHEGALLAGEVTSVDNNWVTVATGLKSEGIIPLHEFAEEGRDTEIKVGDTIRVTLEAFEDGYGETRLSRKKAVLMETWKELQDAYKNSTVVEGVIVDKVRGGLMVALKSVRAFLPGSLVDIRPTREVDHLKDKTLEFKIIKCDSANNNIVVSRRAVLESNILGDASEQHIKEGDVLKGIVKTIVDYGAFIGLGAVDGLLHITHMSRKRLKHPSEVLKMGDEITVQVLKVDEENNRMSLRLQDLGEDPWVDIAARYKPDMRLQGEVIHVVEFGCFVELDPGVEGLVHVSEMDWGNKNLIPAQVVQPGDKVEVMIREVNEERRRISLSMKRCQPSPWEQFASGHKEGEKISGMIRSITDFGIFVTLGKDSKIDGLVHISDLSWERSKAATILKELSKGEELETVILSMEPERERISLGLKQLQDDALGDFFGKHGKHAQVSGTVQQVERRQLLVRLGDGVTGVVPLADASRDMVDDLRPMFQVGQEVSARVINIDRKQEHIHISIKAHEIGSEKEDLREYRSKMGTKGTTESSRGRTLGTLMQEQLGESALPAEAASSAQEKKSNKKAGKKPSAKKAPVEDPEEQEAVQAAATEQKKPSAKKAPAEEPEEQAAARAAATEKKKSPDKESDSPEEKAGAEAAQDTAPDTRSESS